MTQMKLKTGVGFTIVTLLALIACRSEPERPHPPRPVFAIQVADASGLTERSFPGRARAGQEVNLSFRVAGPLITFPVDVGAEVKTGDEVARIDPQDYETALRSLDGQLEREQARAARAQKDLTRILNIQKEDPGATSQAMVDQKREALNSTKADIKSLEAAVDRAKDQLSYTYLRAPFAGVIAKRYVDNFQEVKAKQAIVSLQDINHIEILVDIPENVMATLKRDTASAYAEFTAAPGK